MYVYVCVCMCMNIHIQCLQVYCVNNLVTYIKKKGHKFQI